MTTALALVLLSFPNFSFEYLLGHTEGLSTCLRSLSKSCVYPANLYARFRLTRMGTCPHVTDLLLDATGPLQPLHTRVLEAGCEVNPSWKLGCPSWRDSVGCCTFGRGPEVYQVKLYSTPTYICIFNLMTYFLHLLALHSCSVSLAYSSTASRNSF